MDGTADDEPCCDACWKIAEEFGEAHRMTPCPSNLLETLVGCVSEGDEDSRRWAKAIGEIRSRGTRARNKRTAEDVARS